VEADPVIWTARLRTGRVVIFQASGSRAFRAAVLIDSAVEAEEASVVIAAVAVVDLADSAVIASVAAGDLGAVALAALEALAVAAGADDNI
jgi:hypothetical protein